MDLAAHLLIFAAYQCSLAYFSYASKVKLAILQYKILFLLEDKYQLVINQEK
jgi:hypothetical protein